MIELYRHSKVFRDFVNNELLPPLKKVAGWLFDHLVPAFAALWGFIQRYVIPALITVARGALAGARDALDSVTRAVRRNRPQLELLWSAFKKVYEFVWKYIVPLLGPILRVTFGIIGRQIATTIDIIGGLIRWFTFLAHAGAVMGRDLRGVWDTVRRVVQDRVTSAINWIQKIPDYLRNGFHDAIHWMYDHLVKPVFGLVSDAAGRLFDGLRRIFRTGVEDLHRIWDGLKSVAKAPVSFMINTVLDKGLIPAYNWVAGILPGVNKIKPVHIAGFASGTSKVLPGYTPGRDVHRFYSPTAGVIDLSGGEGIARPELVAAVGAKRWDAANSAAARGDVSQGVRYLGGFALGTSSVGRRVWPTNTRRLSPSYPGHSGVDIAAGMGAPIYAAAPGTITYTGWGHGYGQAIFEKILGSALSIVYGHTSRLIAKAGQKVNAGDLIGRVGATGHATGPHLHFEINSPGPFGNAADRARSLAWLNGANVRGGGGTVGGGGGGLIDYIGQLTRRFAGPLNRLKAMATSPWGRLVAGVPRAFASAMVSSAKDVVGNAFGNLAGAVASGTNKARGLALLTAAGFNPATQWSALQKLWTRESGWRTNATNPSSGAYGIPQALPASKMASAGPDWRTNPNTQIKWGLQYIKDRYGSPAQAWAHEMASGWYDQGGWLKPGTTIVHNDTGKPEPVFSPSQWETLSSGSLTGRPITITLHQDGMQTFVQGVIDDNNAFRSTVGRMRLG
jgi:hypothetical protein